MEIVQCVVERVTYQNSNGWSVLRCSMDGCKDLITIVGNLASAAVGSSLSVEGEWKVDPNYGKQLSVTKWEEKLPATINGIEKYLGGGFIKGIGAKKAKKIVDFFGLDTIRIIEQDFERLAEIPGINKKTAKKKTAASSNTCVVLYGYGKAEGHFRYMRIFQAKA